MVAALTQRFAFAGLEFAEAHQMMLAYFLFLFYSSLSRALDTREIQVLPAGIYQSRPQSRHSVLNETPQGKPLRANPPDCSALALEGAIQKASTSGQHEADTLQAFFNRCDKMISRFSPTKFGTFLRSEEYSIDERKGFSEVVFRLPFQVTLHGLLALKPDSKPRPWAIVICGTGCALSDPASREALELLFDETPFDVLVLPSVSALDFVRENHTIEIGGLQEGRQVFEITNILKSDYSPFRNLISSFHILGISLGGGSALFSAAYASRNSLGAIGPKIQSAIGYCPAINLKQSIDELDRDDLTGRHYKNIILSQTREASGISDDYVIANHNAVEFIEKRIWPAITAMSRRSHFLIPPFDESDIQSMNSFWEANNFLNYSDSVTIPTVVIASDNDFVVNPKSNAMALKAKLARETNSGSVGVFHAAKGWHCEMPQVYGEDIFATMVRGLILKNSPEFKSMNTQIDLAPYFSPKKMGILYDGEKYFGYRWLAQENKSDVTLELKVWAPYKKAGDTNCSSWSPYYAFEGCFRTSEIKIPLSLLNKNGIPQNDAEVQGLIRWLNSHATLETARGLEPVDQIDAPTTINLKED